MGIRPGLRARAVLAACLLCAPVAAFADACAAAGDQAALNACADAGLRAGDAALNEAYRKIAARLKDRAEGLRKLVASERAWMQFRDAECDFAASAAAGGSVAPMLAANCRAALTRARLSQLQTYLSCEEGDLTCPVPPG